MSAILPPTTRLRAQPAGWAPFVGGILSRAGIVLLRIFGVLVAVVLALPVLLLPWATAVPAPVWLLLIAADVALLVVPFRLQPAWLALTATFGGFIATSVIAVLASQAFATTPPITDAEGRPVPNSIATLEKVQLNGSEQWLAIRGKSIHNPVLLFLAGGPGGSQLATARHSLARLEEHFVVVNWDQPGADKSFDAVDRSTLTPGRYVADGHALVLYLRQRFGQEKVFVVGESWGSALGVLLVQRYPELFHAFVGSAQMVAFLETDRQCYEFALRWARERGDTQKVEQLTHQGPPPYYGADMAWKEAAYLLDTFAYMNQNPAVINGFNTPRDLASPEYGLYDKVSWVRGPLETLSIVYPQLWDVDLRAQAPQLQVPVYFFLGRHDINAPPALAEDYLRTLQAPHKELVWFERSGHNPWVSEPDAFVDALVKRVLAQTLPQKPAAPAPSNDPSDAREVAAFLDTLMPTLLREYHIAGAAVTVVKDGDLVASKGYGYADLAAQRPVVAEQTLFRTDSTGKLLVWTAVMQLAERGALDLDADVNRYLDFAIPPTFAEPIKLRHLLSHSAGLASKPYLLARRVEDIEPVGAWLRRNLPARVRPPGVVSGYSNYGTGLAAYIVERVAGMPFEQYAEVYILAPLGMQRSTFRQPLPEALAANLTTNYHYANGAGEPVPFQHLRAQVGEGAMTVTDMAEFMRAHLQDGDSPILAAATARQMHAQLFAHDGRVSGFAYGFAESTLNGQCVLRHEGNLEGVSSSALFLLPEQQLGVYIAYNSNGGFGPGEAFRRAFLNHYFQVAAAPPTLAPLTQEQVAALAGSYRSTTSFARSFAKVLTLLGGLYGDVMVRANADGSFTTEGVGPTPLQWVAVEPGVLRLADGAHDSYGDLVFATDAQGRITRLFVANNPYRAYEKVAWYEAAGFQLGWLGLCALVLLSLLVAVPGGALIGRIFPASGMAAPTLAQWLLVGACVLALGFLVALALALEESLLYGVTPTLIGVLVVPFVALALAVASLVAAHSGWVAMRLVARGHYVAGMVALGGYAGWLYAWNLLGLHF